MDDFDREFFSLVLVALIGGSILAWVITDGRLREWQARRDESISQKSPPRTASPPP